MSAHASVHAVVVAFRPDPKQLLQLVTALAQQVGVVHVVDNTPAGQQGAFADGAIPDGCNLVTLGVNQGVATGFNHGIRLAAQAGATHVLLSDQDSLPSPGMVQSLLATCTSLAADGVDVAVVGPDFFNDVDERSFRFDAIRGAWPFYRRTRPTEAQPVIEVAAVISSGALIPVQSIERVGLMLDAMFIDFVDIEWCERARAKGLRCFADGRARMRHTMGEASMRVWLLNWRTIARYGPLRLRYQAQNASYLLTRRYVDARLKVALAWFLLGKLYAYAVFGVDRRNEVRALVGGLLRGLRGQLAG
jgi:rhamnosyltransferase